MKDCYRTILHRCFLLSICPHIIDEVESLTAARKIALNGSEPSDSIRVVNALLTQIDKLRHRENILIVTTSNLSESIGMFKPFQSIIPSLTFPLLTSRYLYDHVKIILYLVN